jgi:hypothetical protein
MAEKKYTHRDVFRTPFYMDEPGCYIWCKNIYGHDQMCFTILIDWENKEELDRLKRIVDLLNGKEQRPFKYVGYNIEHDLIGVGDTKEDAAKPLLLTRGWGYLTGQGALALPPKEAREIQVEFMKRVLSKLKDPNEPGYENIEKIEE